MYHRNNQLLKKINKRLRAENKTEAWVDLVVDFLEDTKILT